LLNALCSWPLIILMTFSRCLIVTIRGIIIAATKRGQRFWNCQVLFSIVIVVSAIGNEMEAMIDASEMYRQMNTEDIQHAIAISAQRL